MNMRRSLLSVPGNQQRMLDKAMAANARRVLAWADEVRQA